MALRIIVVDDEPACVKQEEKVIQTILPEAELHTFVSALEALEFTKKNPVDIALLDIEMAEMDGITLGKEIKAQRATVNIIFATAFTSYTLSAFQMHASGYLVKPITTDVLRAELSNLRFPVRLPSDGIYATTFGLFDLLVNGKPVHFRRSLSKELLALLIDRHGESLTKRDMEEALFADQEHTPSVQNYINKVCYDMLLSLKEAGAEQIIRHQWNRYSVDPDAFHCDLYEFEAGVPSAINAFRGEYMRQYSWGDETLSKLTKSGRTGKKGKK